MDARALSRVVMIGDAAVGKTCLLNRVLGSKFTRDEVSTVGACWRLFTHECCGSHVELQVWDTAGQEKYRALGPLYYRTALGAVVVYDVTRRPSFDSIPRWIAAFVGTAGANVAIVVVGNKSDERDKREVSDREALEWCDAHHYDWYETSAKTGQNVHAVFELLAEKVARLTAGQMPGVDTDTRRRPTQEQKCC
jgi:small GTP-binding protein